MSKDKDACEVENCSARACCQAHVQGSSWKQLCEDCLGELEALGRVSPGSSVCLPGRRAGG